MPRYSLRTLIIVMLLGGPALAGAWWLLPRIPLNVRIFGHLIGIHIWVAIAAFVGGVIYSRYFARIQPHQSKP